MLNFCTFWPVVPVGKDQGLSKTTDEVLHDRVWPPAAVLKRFHDLLAEGHIDEIGEVFSFASAYDYWRDIAVSAGLRMPQEAPFREMLTALLSSSLVRDELASHRIEGPRERIMGSVACVVFTRAGDKTDEVAATLVREAGVWKIRTYPGVFPGELLSLVNAGPKPPRERLVK